MKGAIRYVQAPIDLPAHTRLVKEELGTRNAELGTVVPRSEFRAPRLNNLW